LAASASRPATARRAGLPRAEPAHAKAARPLTARPWLREAAVCVAFIAVGAAVTWPRALYLGGTIPEGNDQAQYVWNFWWIAHQLTHFGNPWFTSYLAAPVGIQLGFDTLLPLPGVVLAPVTLLFGPAVSYNLFGLVLPGLACYAMYRAARLWLPTRTGAVAAGAFFGLSGMLTFQAWAHNHTAAGAVFLPLAMETAIRLRRRATIGHGVILGLVLGAAMLVDQEFAVLAVILAALLLVPWLLRGGGAALRATGAGALTALIIASPQLAAMVQQAAAGGAAPPPVSNYIRYAAQLPALFAPSPLLSRYGLNGFAAIYHSHSPGEGLATFGLVLTLLGLLGLAVSWRRRNARLLGLLWLGSVWLALGPTLYFGGHNYVPLPQRWHGLRVSLLMPYSWLIRVPGMSAFREADRLAFVGLVAAALLAGAAVEWIRRNGWPLLIAVVVFGAMEAGWPAPQFNMPAALPAVDRPIAADHSGSTVVDVPFGIMGIPLTYGSLAAPPALVQAAADGHPRAIAYGPPTSRQLISKVSGHAFYATLLAAQRGAPVTPAQLAAARRDLRGLHVGWVLVWLPRWTAVLHPPRLHPFHYPDIVSYLTATGFHLSYQAEGVAVYRP
jgi:hypothetical protein